MEAPLPQSVDDVTKIVAQVVDKAHHLLEKWTLENVTPYFY